MGMYSALWILMALCFSTWASVFTVLSTHPCVSSYLWVNRLQNSYCGLFHFMVCVMFFRYKIWFVQEGNIFFIILHDDQCRSWWWLVTAISETKNHLYEITYLNANLKWLKFLGHLLIKIPNPFGFELNQHSGFIILQYMLIQVWEKH